MDSLKDMPIGEYSEFVGAFLESFDRLAMALGGVELIRQCKQEINFRIYQGAPIEEAVSEVYYSTKRRYGI